jgi:adenylate cyclase
LQLWSVRKRLREIMADGVVQQSCTITDEVFNTRHLGNTDVAAEALVETLVERGCDGDLAEAEAAIDRMENLPGDFRWAARDIAVSRLRALLSQSRGEKAAYQDLAQRYRSDGDITWL